MRAPEQRQTRAVTLRDLLLLFLAHLMWIVELLEKLVWVFDPVDAEIEIVDVLVAGPQPRGFVRRVRTIRCQRKVRIAGGDSWRFLRFRLLWRRRSARADDVEAEDRSDERKIDDNGRK